jgi:hypothetical protein
VPWSASRKLLPLASSLALLTAQPAAAKPEPGDPPRDAGAATEAPQPLPVSPPEEPDVPPVSPPDEPVVPPAPPPAVPVPEPPPPRPENVFSGRPPKDDASRTDEERSWFDSGHEFVGRMFFAPAVRIDRFFSDESELDPERAESFARFRSSARLSEDGRPVLGAEVLADIRLPGVNRWLERTRVVITGASDSLEPNEVEGATTPPAAARDPRAGNLELRFGAYRGIRSSVDLGAGVLFRLPPGAFARVRYRLAVPIEDRLLGRLSSQVFWRTDMHLGARLTAGLDWPASDSSLLRLATATQVAQERTSGVEYAAELVYSYAFTPRSAVALGTDAQGNTDVRVGLERYRVYTRFRQDVLRRWLFVELEPEIAWPWTPRQGRYRAYAITFRLEVQFDGNRAAEGSQ